MKDRNSIARLINLNKIIKNINNLPSYNTLPVDLSLIGLGAGLSATAYKLPDWQMALRNKAKLLEHKSNQAYMNALRSGEYKSGKWIQTSEVRNAEKLLQRSKLLRKIGESPIFNYPEILIYPAIPALAGGEALLFDYITSRMSPKNRIRFLLANAGIFGATALGYKPLINKVINKLKLREQQGLKRILKNPANYTIEEGDLLTKIRPKQTQEAMKLEETYGLRRVLEKSRNPVVITAALGAIGIPAILAAGELIKRHRKSKRKKIKLGG